MILNTLLLGVAFALAAVVLTPVAERFGDLVGRKVFTGKNEEKLDQSGKYRFDQ